MKLRFLGQNNSNSNNQTDIEIKKKKKEAFKILIKPTMISFANGAIPKPTVEIATEAATVIPDAIAFIKIWEIYFEKEISTQDIIEIFKKIGIAKSTGAIATYVVIKISDGAINEIGNILGPVGWLVEGVLSGSITIVAGYVWINFCEQMYLEYGSKFDKDQILDPSFSY